MTEPRPFLSRSIASVVDQVLLSGLNFAIGIALIRYASKETYGLYSQLFAAGVLSTTLLEALIGSALTTLSARLPAAEGHALVARTLRIQWVASGVLALVAGVGIGVLSVTVGLSENPTALALAFAAFIFALGCREYCRTALFIASRPEQVVKVDAAFVVFTLLGSALFLLIEHITVTEIMCLLALTNGLAALLYSHYLVNSEGARVAWRRYLDDFQLLWSLGRWALIGSVAGWLVNNSYLYAAGGFLGVAALADLNAARLLLIPIAILGVAWARVARPPMGQMINAGEWGGLRSFMRKSMLALEVFTVGYVAALWLAFPWLSTHVLGEKYQHIVHLLLLWGVYFAVNAARNVGTIALTSFGAFKALFWQGIASLPILVVACWLLMPRFGVMGALGAMITVEAWELLVNGLYLLPLARRQHLALE